MHNVLQFPNAQATGNLGSTEISLRTTFLQITAKRKSLTNRRQNSPESSSEQSLRPILPEGLLTAIKTTSNAGGATKTSPALTIRP